MGKIKMKAFTTVAALLGATYANPIQHIQYGTTGMRQINNVQINSSNPNNMQQQMSFSGPFQMCPTQSQWSALTSTFCKMASVTLLTGTLLRTLRELRRAMVTLSRGTLPTSWLMAN